MKEPPVQPLHFRKPAELVRIGVLIAAGVLLTWPFFTRSFLGGTDARWYASMLEDFLQQMRSGHFPVFVGQGQFAWNGGIHPFRSAPFFMDLAGLWDLVTLHSLGVYTLQHLTVITCAVAGALGFYAAGVALAPGRRWEMMLVALLYVAAPIWPAIIYGSDAYMSFMAVGAMPLLLYGNARSVLAADGSGYGRLAAGLALVWMCHPPVAILATLGTLILQGGTFVFGPGSAARRRGALRGVLLFAGFAAYYFVSMGEHPSRPHDSPIPDILQLGGLALVLGGLGLTILRRRHWGWLALWAPGGLMLWAARPPWFWWMLATILLVVAVVAAARWLFRWDTSGRGCEILFPCLIVSAAITQAWLGAAGPGPNPVSIYGLHENAARAVNLFLPVTAPYNDHGNYQPGMGLWIFLAVLAAAFFGARSLAVKLFFVAALLPLFALVRVPGVSDFLVGYFPDYIADIVNFPLTLRLVPVMTGFLAMGAAVWVARESLGATFYRVVLVALLAAAVAWDGAQDSKFVFAGMRLAAGRDPNRDDARPENVVTAHFVYDVLPIPSYFSEGVFDPRLECRLLDDKMRELVGPDAIARQMETAGATRLRVVARVNPDSPNWLDLQPGLTLAPGEHVLLRFEFDPARDYTGWLLFRSEHGYREYHLPDTGLPKGFGIKPDRAHVLSLWNSGTVPEHYRLTMTREAGNDIGGNGGFFATMVVSHYDAVRNPVRLDSLMPLRVNVTAVKPGWLETVRVFLPGYSATVDGRSVPVVSSPEQLAMVPILPGRHSVVLRYRGTPSLWLAALVSAGTWVGWFGGIWRRRRLHRGAGKGGSRIPPGTESRMEADGQAARPCVGSTEGDAAAVRRFKGCLTVAAIVAVVAGVILFDAWTVKTSGGSFGSNGAQNEYYNQLVAGFRQGHLYMDAPVNPALLALPESKRPGGAPYLLDASLYRNHYYLYFGVTPAVVLFWPYAILTGHPLSTAVAALAFGVAGFAFGAAWWIEVRRRFFPLLAGKWLVLGILAVGFCSVVPSTLRHPLFYEVAIGSGYAFTMLALWAIVRARFSPARRSGWLALAGVAAGLAVGSRANLAVACVLLLVLGSAAAARAAGASAARRRIFLAGLAASGLGIGSIGVGLAAYNFARFGNVLEFGHKYQLGLNPQQMFHAENLRHNLRIYYFTPPALNGYFPFVAPAQAPPPPNDYIGREHTHGEWIWMLLAGLAVLSAAWALRRPDLALGDWGWTLAPPALVFAVNLLVVGAAGARANRYMLDFHPALVLVTLLALAPALAGRGPWSSVARFAGAAGILLAVAFNVFASIQVHGFFSQNRPADYARLEQSANRMAWPWLRTEAAAVGDRELEVRWPRNGVGLGGIWEPILATGTPGFDDILWVQYDGSGRAQLIYEHGEYGSAFGDWFPLPAGGVSRLRISGAFLLPPLGHPWYGDRPSDEQDFVKRRVRAIVDGVTRFDRDVPSYDSSPRLQQWGAWRAGDTVLEHRFSGTLGPASVLPIDDREAVAAAHLQGDVRFRLMLPRDRFGSIEPLVQSGSPEAFDTLAIEYTDRGHVRLIHDSLGAGADESEPFPVDYRETQWVDVETPFANDGLRWTAEGAEGRRAVPGSQLRVRWNGRDVFESKLPLHPADPRSVALGGSSLRSSQARLMYAGGIEPSPRREPLGSVRSGTLDCRLPSWDALADERGVLVRFDRADGEFAALIWRHSGGRIQIGWVDAETMEWSPPLPTDRLPPFLRMVISPPQAAEGVTIASDTVKYESLEVSCGSFALLAAATDIFSTGPVNAGAILPPSWSGSALAPSNSAAAPAPPLPALPGRVRIRFRLPPDGRTSGDPLLSAGKAGAADSIYLRQVGEGSYVLGLDHWASPAHETAPLKLDSANAHTVVIELGSLFSPGVIPRDAVRLILDGRVVMAARVPLYPVAIGEVAVGRNPLGMSTSVDQFRGEIISVRTHQPPSAQPR